MSIGLLTEWAALGGTALIATAAYATFVPHCTWWGSMVLHGHVTEPPRVALTFDDGPTVGATDRVLDHLGEQNVKAAFFVIGRNVERCPDLLKRIDAEGHVIGNHTYDHHHHGVMRAQRYWDRQVDHTDALIEQITGRRPAYFRPPMGIKTWHTVRAARRSHSIILWSRRALDGVRTTPQRILNRVVPHAQNGDIIALHDGLSPQSRRDPSATLQALAPLVKGLRDRGLEPVRLDALIELAPYAR